MTAETGLPSDSPIFEVQFGLGPLVAAAVHDGHGLRAEVASRLAVSPGDRLHEEDPHTAFWTTIAPTRLVALRSRFEMDLNRPRQAAVYRTPKDAWGLEVWQEAPPEDVVERSLVQHDAFYRQVRTTLEVLVAQFGRVLVLDLHSYNYRRAGSDGPVADPVENPDINLGTGTMERKRWVEAVERFMAELRRCKVSGEDLDVRENVRFPGGYFSRWIHETFSESACCLAVEVKKFFMDEWTGEVDQGKLYDIGEALRRAAAAALEVL